MSKTLKRQQKEQRRLREQERKQALFRRPEDMGFDERLQYCADGVNKSLEYLFEEKLVRVGSSTKMVIEGEVGEKSYLLLMFPSSVWKYEDKKLQLKTKEGV